MRVYILTVAILLAACDQIKKSDVVTMLDEQVVMPDGAGPLADYERYYAKTESGWVGLLNSTNKGKGKATLTTESKLPEELDGGCDIVNVTFDTKMKLVSAFCNGDA